MRVRGVYAFAAETAEELSFAEGEVLSVTNQDIGGGWFEVENAYGQRGFVPENYCEEMVGEEPSDPLPPPPQPQDAFSAFQNSLNSQLSNIQPAPAAASSHDDSWDTPFSYPAARAPAQAQPMQQQQQPPQQVQPQMQYVAAPAAQQVAKRHSPSITSSTTDFAGEFYSDEDEDTRKSSQDTKMKIKKGADGFLLGTVSANVPPDEVVRIIFNQQAGEIQWYQDKEHFSIKIPGHSNSAKLGGLKAFTEYELTQSCSDVRVKRRYKHFDWLREQLTKKYFLVSIPQLPSKKVTGRFEDKFIEQRQQQLSRWMTRMANHPVVSHSPVFKHFITIPADSKAWKTGKRAFEGDDLNNGKWVLAIEQPASNTIPDVNSNTELEKFTRFIKDMTKATADMEKATGHFQENQLSMKGDYQNMGAAIGKMADNLNNYEWTNENTSSINFMQRVCASFTGISDTYDAQAGGDTEPLLEALGEYNDSLKTFPAILRHHKEYASKAAELSRLNPGKQQEIQGKLNTVTYAVLAERNHFYRQQVGDLTNMCRVFVEQQLAFHKGVVVQLSAALSALDPQSYS